MWLLMTSIWEGSVEEYIDTLQQANDRYSGLCRMVSCANLKKLLNLSVLLSALNYKIKIQQSLTH